jgi:hypothetical protein
VGSLVQRARVVGMPREADAVDTVGGVMEIYGPVASDEVIFEN